MLGDSNTGSLYFFLLILLINSIVIPNCTASLIFYNSPLQMILKRKVKTKEGHIKEEEDIDILCSWIEVGGQPALPEGDAQGLLAEVSKFPCPLFLFHPPFSILVLFLICYPLFPYNLDVLDCYWLFSSFFVGCETAPVCKHKEGRGKEARSRGPAARD